MATTTTFLGLRKPATSDNVNVTLDISDNMDGIDAAIQSLDTRLDAIEGAWSSYTPSLTGVTASSATGRYRQNGKTVIYSFKIVVNAAPTNVISVSVPAVGKSGLYVDGVPLAGTVTCVDASSTGRYPVTPAWVNSSLSAIMFWVGWSSPTSLINAAWPAMSGGWTSGDVLEGTVIYEAA